MMAMSPIHRPPNSLLFNPASREKMKQPAMTDVKSSNDGAMDVHMKDGARAEKIKISVATAICTHTPACACREQPVLLAM
jgi:hypothetical protein